MKIKPAPKASVVDGLDDLSIAHLLHAARKPAKQPAKRPKGKRS